MYHRTVLTAALGQRCAAVPQPSGASRLETVAGFTSHTTNVPDKVQQRPPRGRWVNGQPPVRSRALAHALAHTQQAGKSSPWLAPAWPCTRVQGWDHCLPPPSPPHSTRPRRQPVPRKVKFLHLVEGFPSGECGAFISHDLSHESAQRTLGALERACPAPVNAPRPGGSAAGAAPNSCDHLSFRAGGRAQGSVPGNHDLKAKQPRIAKRAPGEARELPGAGTAGRRAAHFSKGGRAPA